MYYLHFAHWSLKCIVIISTLFKILSSQQLYTDAATGDLQDDLQGDVTELEQLITELQDLSAHLRSQ